MVLERCVAKLWSQRDEQSRELAALRTRLAAAEQTAREAEDRIAIALHKAVAPIYFADSSDYIDGLYSVVRALNPVLWEQMEDGATDDQFEATQVAADAARAPHTTEGTIDPVPKGKDFLDIMKEATS